MKYVDTHRHTTFSFKDGFGTPDEHARRSAELGMTAQFVTEHGNVSSHAQHERACSKYGIKAGFGLEAYMHPDPSSRRKFHMTLLAENAIGYANLMSITSRSWSEGFYQWPTVTGEILGDHAEGIIVLSGCSDSLLSCSLLGGKTIDPSEASLDRAMSVAARFKDIFGDRYYLETQMFPQLERTGILNTAFEQMGKKLGIPLVATSDTHYPYPGDNVMQLTLHAAGRGAADVSKQAEGWEYDIALSPPESDRDVIERLRGTGLSLAGARQAARSTVEIAQRCTVTLPKAERLRYPIGEGRTAEEEIWDLLREGWRYRVRQGNRNLRERPGECEAKIRYEMERITGKDFIDYHLMISDLVRWAKDRGIPVGPGRGSCAASIVCYLLRITEIDPMDYPLMFFERYIDPNREDEPDIDLDFDDERRHEVEEYAISKYGAHRVAKLATFTRYKGKNSIDDVARVNRVPREETELAKSMVLERSGGDSRAESSLSDTLDMFPQAKALFDKYPALYQALRLEGNYREMSTHAAGLLIANSRIADTCAQYTRTDKNGVVHVAASVDKKDAAYLGMMKVDLLGLTTMGMLRRALEMSDMTLEDLYRVTMDEPATLDAFRRNDVIGIFQFEGRATRVVCGRVKPDNFMEIADIGSLSRPGPLFSGTTYDYVDVKWGRAKAARFHPIIDDLTKDTKGQIIYQEQVLLILDRIGGLPVARVHEIRKIISQKLGEAQFNASAEDFIRGAGELHGIDSQTAQKIWGRLVTSATYAFNVAHSVSYGMLAFWCMWMKVHHPEAFYAAQLQKIAKEKWPRLIRDAEQHGIRVRGVSLTESGRTWTLDRTGKRPEIAAGWEQLHGIGEATAGKILAHIDSGKRFEHVSDLLEVNGIGPATLEKMRPMIAAKDPFGLRRVGKALKAVRRAIEAGEIPVPRPTYISNDMVDLPEKTLIRWMGIVRLKEYKDYIEDQRARTGETFDEIRRRIRHPELTTSCFMHCYDDADEDVYVRAARLSYPKWRKAIEGIREERDVIIVEGKKGGGVFGANLYVNRLWVIDPED